MSEMRSEDAWKALDQVNGWIRFADGKAVALLAAAGAFGGLLVNTVPHRADFRTHASSAVLQAAALACVGCAALIALRALWPVLRTADPRSLLYFDQIARRYGADRHAFVDQYVAGFPDGRALARQLANQGWANSMVALAKFRATSFAAAFLTGGMGLAGTAVIIRRLWNL